MELGAFIDRLPGGLEEDLCIFAVRPWTRGSKAIAVHLDSEFKAPEKVLSEGFSYFMEVRVANEVLEVFGERRPSVDEKQSLLLFYAENDAFPDWVYTR